MAKDEGSASNGKKSKDELKRYQELSMDEEAKLYCMGILKGIYRFEKESESEFKGWATDAPREYFGSILSDWKKECKNPQDLKEMEDFLMENCPEWVK